jgi:N-acetylmuramoyl-L-alanine amidase CwlA
MDDSNYYSEKSSYSVIEKGIIKRVMEASQERIKKHRELSRKRKQRVVNEHKQLNSFCRKMMRDGNQRIFKRDSSVSARNKDDTVKSLYYEGRGAF